MSGFFVATYLHPSSPRDDAQSAEQIARLLMSVEPTLAIAHKAALHMGPQKDERARYPQLTDERIRYRRAPFVYDTKAWWHSDPGAGPAVASSCTRSP